MTNEISPVCRVRPVVRAAQRPARRLCLAVVCGDLAQGHEQIGFIALGKLPEVRRQGHN